MFNLKGALAEGLRQKEAKHKWPEGKMHASDTGIYLKGSDGRCERQFWLRFNGYEREPDKPGKLLRYEQGNNLEEKVIEFVRKGLPGNIRLVAEQMDITHGLPYDFTGRLDILFANEEGQHAVVDIKTWRGNAFNYNDEAKPANKLQVATYIYALNDIFNKPVNKGAVFPVDREGDNFAEEFWFLYTLEWEWKVKKALAYVKKISEMEKPPAKNQPKITINENKGDNSIKVELPWQCDWCSYRGVSCKGAIPADYEEKIGKVCGHINQQGFTPLDEVEGIEQYVEPVLKQKEVI